MKKLQELLIRMLQRKEWSRVSVASRRNSCEFFAAVKGVSIVYRSNEVIVITEFSQLDLILHHFQYFDVSKLK